MLTHLWMPNIFEFKGGVQVYSQFLLQALQNGLDNHRYEVFLKHDRQAPLEPTDLVHTNFHCTGQWHPQIRTLAFASQIGWHGLQQKPDLILSTHLNFTPIGYWLKKIANIPYWAIAHGVDAWNLKNPTLIRALQHADRILAVSNYTRDRLLQEQPLDPAKVGLLPNTFDASRFQIAPKPAKLLQRYHLTADQPVILTVARLDSSEQYKGYDRILLALPEIRRHVPNVRYLLVGKGNDRPRIEQLIAKHHLEDCVTLAGFVPDAELGDHYNLCDVFAMPSKGEGFGIVYLEALACGKPTIGGNQDGAIDALCGGQLGVLVDPDNHEQLADRLIQILQKTYAHPLLYCPEVLRQEVINVYGFERFQQTLVELFNPDHP